MDTSSFIFETFGSSGCEEPGLHPHSVTAPNIARSILPHNHSGEWILSQKCDWLMNIIPPRHSASVQCQRILTLGTLQTQVATNCASEHEVWDSRHAWQLSAIKHGIQTFDASTRHCSSSWPHLTCACHASRKSNTGNCTETQEENHDTQLFLSLQSTSKDASKPPVHLQGGMMEGRHTGYFFIQIFKLYQVPPFLDLVPFQNTFKLFMVHTL